MSKLAHNFLTALALTIPTTAMAQPVINAVLNNFSGTLPGLPNYGIAPASLFVIYGSGMCDQASLVTQSSSAKGGLPTTLNHMTLSVTINNITTTPAIYYAIPTQVAAVLPSTTPVGTGVIKVNYNGQITSAPIQVTKTAFGMLTQDAGGGPVTATDLEYKDFSPTASAAPGQTIVLWGSGLGADTANDDRTYPMKQDNLQDATVYIGGVQATVLYAGRSQFPGVDQINVTVPSLGATPAFETASLQDRDVARAASGFQGGCANSVVVVSNGIASNFGTLPINPGGGLCRDPEFGTDGNVLGFGADSAITVGGLSLFQVSQPTAPLPAPQKYETYDYAAGNFFATTGAAYFGASSYSYGSCVVYNQPSTSSSAVRMQSEIKGFTPRLIGASAGSSIAFTGGSLSVALAETATNGTGVGQYYAQLPAALTANTAYTFTAPGGADIGPFAVPVTWPGPLDWTNESSITAIKGSQGQLITWSGGAPGSYIEIYGYVAAPAVLVDVAFTCISPIDDGQFMIPSYVLQTLPSGNGLLEVEDITPPATFTANGLSYGYLTSGSVSTANVTYNLGQTSTGN
jgi:uncharacterized protein (TIGR03437 family)